MIPPSATPDRGWMGDPRRGAAMGRPSHGVPPTDSPVMVGRIHLDGDYDQGGTYWGGGTPLYEAFAEDYYEVVRAANLEAAIAHFQAAHPEARFEPREPADSDFDAFFNDFLVAMTWCAPEGDVQDAPAEEIAEESISILREECHAFWDTCMKDVHAKLIAEHAGSAGHDFALTRSGCGAGFGDGDWPEELDKRLEKLAKSFGEINLYRGDDGKVYLE